MYQEHSVRGNWMENPPLFSKGAKQGGGILHNGGILVKISTIFPTVLDVWVVKIFACGAISIVFLVFVLIAAFID